MVAICICLLDNGRQCQAPALQNSGFCRHHDPHHPPLRPDRRRVAPPQLSRAQLSAHWRAFPDRIADATAEALPDFIDDLLNALAERAICHRSAGRIFAAIADRRCQLERETQQTAWHDVKDRVAELARRGGHAVDPAPFEALGDLPAFQLPAARGPRHQPATR